jgi:hypothetical protein
MGVAKRHCRLPLAVRGGADMNPGYPNQPTAQQYQQQAPYQQPVGPALGGGGGAAPAKKYPVLLVAAIGLGIFVLCNWVVGAFNLDGDFGRILAHTGGAGGTAGLGVLLLAGFWRLTEKDKDHPAGVGLGLVVCVLIIAAIGLASVLRFR